MNISPLVIMIDIILLVIPIDINRLIIFVGICVFPVM